VAKKFLDWLNAGRGGENQKQSYATYLVHKAEAGDVEAQFFLGASFAGGMEGFPKDYEQAIKWYRKSAELGYAKAQVALGLCYKEGQGVLGDYKEAVKWFMKSAEQGDAEGQCFLGYSYAIGEGVPQDIDEAVKWWTKAAKQGQKDAIKELRILKSR
jgi:TPR repeat protein